MAARNINSKKEWNPIGRKARMQVARAQEKRQATEKEGEKVPLRHVLEEKERMRWML
jgi:hypothetical protein